MAKKSAKKTPRESSARTAKTPAKTSTKTTIVAAKDNKIGKVKIVNQMHFRCINSKCKNIVKVTQTDTYPPPNWMMLKLSGPGQGGLVAISNGIICPTCQNGLFLHQSSGPFVNPVPTVVKTEKAAADFTAGG